MSRDDIEVLSSRWYSSLNSYSQIGIIKIRPIDSKYVYTYMGTTLPGNTEEQDIEAIISWGSRIKTEEILDDGSVKIIFSDI